MCDIKTGVELELWVVDDNGRLADGSEIVAAHEQIKPEFIDPLVEVQTEPHEDEFGLRRDLETTLRTGVRVAEKHDKQLVPLGHHSPHRIRRRTANGGSCSRRSTVTGYRAQRTVPAHTFTSRKGV
ncbi:glutamate--cysteine ligase family protein [Haloarcula amylolytica]|uniref:hypothetical protein n=1 Tax=Haloarcula amylolytica TaxID=396317 RepID=UPI00195533C0|nr:hypothetical protein [Haloarcula amylolytica]